MGEGKSNVRYNPGQASDAELKELHKAVGKEQEKRQSSAMKYFKQRQKKESKAWEHCKVQARDIAGVVLDEEPSDPITSIKALVDQLAQRCQALSTENQELQTDQSKVIVGEEYHKFQDLPEIFIHVDKKAYAASQILSSWPTYYADVCTQLRAVNSSIATLSLQRQQAQGAEAIAVSEMAITAKRKEKVDLEAKEAEWFVEGKRVLADSDRTMVQVEATQGMIDRMHTILQPDVSALDKMPLQQKLAVVVDFKRVNTSLEQTMNDWHNFKHRL